MKIWESKEITLFYYCLADPLYIVFVFVVFFGLSLFVG